MYNIYFKSHFPFVILDGSIDIAVINPKWGFQSLNKKKKKGT